MAESSGTSIKINIKTPKDKKEIEINSDANIKEVSLWLETTFHLHSVLKWIINGSIECGQSLEVDQFMKQFLGQTVNLK